MTQKFSFWVYAQKKSEQGLDRYLYTNVHSSSIPNSQSMEANTAPMNK